MASSSSSSSAYANVRAAIATEGNDARVEVNQRALIDKILARYASNNAVYRELLQNSNDADATSAEIIITTSSSSSAAASAGANGSDNIDGGSSSAKKEVVTQVIYRNNGLPFRSQDWARLRKIAEGNPDESKVGAFGVGAYTMFSICEEPLVVSGKKGEEEVMSFFWKGDALWTKTGKAPPGIVNVMNNDSKNGVEWTSFILPSRDPYPIPDMVEFGQFLTASLTFTQCLKTIRVYVNQTLCMNIEKKVLESHTIHTPKASSWWKNDGAMTSSSTGMFTFGKGSDLTQTSVQMNVSLPGTSTSTVRARYASAQVKTNIPSNVEKRMVRVTKKKPPKELMVQIFLDAANEEEDDTGSTKSSTKRRSNKQSNRASLITDAFAPPPGSGRIFIGFRTSQTTGLGIHLAAPFLPTVEREAIDFVDVALREYNSELLEISGMLMRLALEHEMGRIGMLWDNSKDERDKWEAMREEQMQKKELQKDEEEKDDNSSSKATKEDDASSTKNESIPSSLLSFASFMARGVKSTVKEALVKPALEILGEDNETTELLNPRDDRPLSIEERDAILLMKAYCPQRSTPDSLVGHCLAKGFSRCLPSSSPPVLTQGGVMRGSDAKLPNLGLEAFGFNNVVRRIMLENAREYHSVIANVSTLTIEDLIFSLKNQILDEKMLIRLLKWLPKASRRLHIADRNTVRLKEVIRFESSSSSIEECKATPADVQEAVVHRLDTILYYTPNKSLQDLPLPETAFLLSLQNEIGLRTLENSVYQYWFSSLPFDIWTSYISQHPCLIEGKPGEMNIQVLTALSKHFDSLEGAVARRRFIALLPTMVIPFDSSDSSKVWQTAPPSELYLASSDLSAFAGVGVFNHVSKRLSKVSDAFLLEMGVRTTIAIDFLFLHLDTLRWNTNPKPLIKYLLDADLSHSDLVKLKSTQYLPAEKDQSRVYAPSELYLKNTELEIFPFSRFLQWPASEGMSKAHRDFLIKLGVRVDPPLSSVMAFMEDECKKNEDLRDDKVYEAALQFLTNRLGPQGIYEKDFAKYKSSKFLPCIRQNLETGDIINEMQSPAACYYNPSSLIMGFSTLDPKLDTLHIATRVKANKDPSCKVLITRLLQLVNISKAKVDHFEKANGTDNAGRKKLGEQLLPLFDAVFQYLATRTSDFVQRDLAGLSKTAFIPCMTRGQVMFYLPSQIFFKSSPGADTSEDDESSLTGTLFQQIKYNAFLSVVGVKEEPSLHEIFTLMIEKPDEVLDSLGETKYKTLLRRIASNPPVKHITSQIRQSPFLLGYLVIDEECGGDNNDEEGKDQGQQAQYVLARAEDIYIVDNSFLRRQFPMLVAPMEQTLEEFYNKIGSKYVSQVVKKNFEVVGRTYKDTPLTDLVANRLRERKPLLLSPTNSSRPLVANASKVLDDQYLNIMQADKIQAKYSFERSFKHLKVTCCAKKSSKQITTIFVTTSPDWFDVATTVGALILQRCQLEDALLLSQLLESPIETLRYRGFPVDRILRPVSKPQPPPQPSKPTPLAAETKQARPEAINDSAVKGTQPKSNGSAQQQKPAGMKKGDDGFASILQQMFPSCPAETIQGLLGPDATKEKAAQVANMLATEMPPSKDGSKDQDESTGKTDSVNTDAAAGAAQNGLIDNSNINEAKPEAKPDAKPDTKPTKKKSSGLMNKLKGKMGLHHHHNHNHGSGGGQGICTESGTGGGGQWQPNPDPNKPSSPENDASTHQSLENMLSQAVQSSRSVDHAGLRSPETLINSLPEGLERGDNGCEVIPAQNIQPFRGPHGDFKTRNGIKVFSAAGEEGHDFLTQNFNAVERFAVVIQHLTMVYKLNLSTVCIYYEPNGNTIAFNSNKALHFNFRFFAALHQNSVDYACYSYWYITFAHELAHNLVSAHNKEHGSFTENIASLYLPEFIKLLSQIF